MTCPSCGVPVVPGYARCPKCHTALPQRAVTSVEGGTSLSEERPRVPPTVFIAVGVVGVASILWLGLRHRGGDKPPTVIQAAPQRPQQVAQAPNLAPAAPDEPHAPRAPQPEAVASDLQAALRRQRLWSAVSVIGSRVDVRSGSCSDPAMKPALDSAAPQFKAAGLTTLRCVEESGAVVFTRDL
ncbi:MAG TPA: hypothetical protein VLT45_31715 [Kofleriaceae bacterium]|nr:hypothetical protein [Kofleriaceae bacterium]